MTSRVDYIAPKLIENHVVVPPGLQVNEMTLREHQDYLVWMLGQRQLTREEAIICAHRPKEIESEWPSTTEPP